MKKTIEIPFGAKDSELKGWEYTIPKGLKARIEGNKIILEPKESEDERIRKELFEFINGFCAEDNHPFTLQQADRWLAWLEKQGEQKFPSLSEKEIVCLKRILDFLREEHNSYTGKDFTNEIAVLEWLITHPTLIHSSELQLNQGSQNLANSVKTCKVEPKFKVDDWVVTEEGKVNQVKKVSDDSDAYALDDGTYFSGSWKDLYHLWTIQDAKPGDILNSVRVQATIIFKGFNPDGKHIDAYCALQKGLFIHQELPWDRDFEPALAIWVAELFKRMNEEGYSWDAEKQELITTKQKHFLSKDDEYTLARIIERLEDDGCPSEWLTLLNDIYSMPYQKSSEWSEEDENMLNAVIHLLRTAYTSTDGIDEKVEFLKTLKSRVQSQWKPSEEQMKAIKHVAEQNRASEIGNILDNLLVEL